MRFAFYERFGRYPPKATEQLFNCEQDSIREYNALQRQNNLQRHAAVAPERTHPNMSRRNLPQFRAIAPKANAQSAFEAMASGGTMQQSQLNQQSSQPLVQPPIIVISNPTQIYSNHSKQ